MKRIASIIVCCLLTAATASAQSENPIGLYKLQKLSYEKGKPDHTPEFTQYKYCSDFAPITIMTATATPKEYVFVMRQDEPSPYTFTGNQLVGQDGHGTRIYDSNDEHFTLTWFNTVRPGAGGIFPMNEFITEKYDKKNIEPQMIRSIEMMKMKKIEANHKFAGCWKMMGNIGTYQGHEIVMKQVTDLYKIYGEKDVVLVFTNGDQISGSTVYYWPLQVKEDKQIVEGKNNCKIEWRGEGSFVLTFNRANDGTECKELWARSGMPNNFQSLFGTNVPQSKINIPSSF